MKIYLECPDSEFLDQYGDFFNLLTGTNDKVRYNIGIRSLADDFNQAGIGINPGILGTDKTANCGKSTYRG